MAKKREKKPLPPKVTFVGGKWYNEYGKEVPKPQPKPIAAVQQELEPLQRYDTDEMLERLAGCTCTKPELTGRSGLHSLRRCAVRLRARQSRDRRAVGEVGRHDDLGLGTATHRVLRCGQRHERAIIVVPGSDSAERWTAAVLAMSLLGSTPRRNAIRPSEGRP